MRLDSWGITRFGMSLWSFLDSTFGEIWEQLCYGRFGNQSTTMILPLIILRFISQAVAMLWQCVHQSCLFHSDRIKRGRIMEGRMIRAQG